VKASVDIYTVKQASLALGVSPKRVRQLIEEGKLKVHSREPITVKQVGGHTPKRPAATL